MNILLAFNSGYFMPARVLAHSLLAHNPCFVRIYVMYSSLTEEEKALLCADAAESGHAEVVYIPVPSGAFSDAPLHCKWISVETYYRLLAQELLPADVERILYLDADMVVTDSLEEFYSTDFKGTLLMACNAKGPGEIAPKVLEQRTLPPDTVYFNAGVLLYNLAGQRESIDPQIFHDYPAMFYDRLPFGDQDVLNAVFYRQVKFADFRRYNLFDVELKDKSEEEKKALLDGAAIFHFNGFGKPWTFQYWGGSSDLFWRYANDFPEYAPLMPGMLLAQKQYAADREKRKREEAEKKKAEEEKQADKTKEERQCR